jgi:hypothetical protein
MRLGPVVSLFLLTACSGSAGAPPAPVADPCVFPKQGPAADTISIALPESGAHGQIERLTRSASVPDCQDTMRTIAASFQLVGPDSAPLVMQPADSGPPVLMVRRYGGESDPRDLIDRGADLVITDRPDAIEYAVTRGDRRTVPLAWSTIYALAYAPAEPAPVAITTERREELARDAVRADARPTEAPPWWGSGLCRVPPNTPVVRLPGIAIAGNDPIARALAERLVAVAGSSIRRVLSLSPAQFDSVARKGAASAFIVALPAGAPVDCQAVPPLPVGWTLVPLIQTRATMVVGPRVPAFVVLGDGTFAFVPTRP